MFVTSLSTDTELRAFCQATRAVSYAQRYKQALNDWFFDEIKDEVNFIYSITLYHVRNDAFGRGALATYLRWESRKCFLYYPSRVTA